MSTLARCMQVSQHLNALAELRLYRDIRWGNHLPSRFAPSPPAEYSSGIRISLTKRDIVKGIRTLRLDDHGLQDCSSLLDHYPEEQNFGRLHIDLLTDEAQSPRSYRCPLCPSIANRSEEACPQSSIRRITTCSIYRST